MGNIILNYYNDSLVHVDEDATDGTRSELLISVDVLDENFTELQLDAKVDVPLIKKVTKLSLYVIIDSFVE